MGMYVHYTMESLTLNLEIGETRWHSTVTVNNGDSALSFVVSHFINPTGLRSTIFVFCSESGRWQGIYVILALQCVLQSQTHTYYCTYSETSLIRHSMGPENSVGLGGCRITECLLPCFNMVTVPHEMVGLERMLDCTDVGLERFHCIYVLLMWLSGSNSLC